MPNTKHKSHPDVDSPGQYLPRLTMEAGIEITNAFVDFNVGYSNPPELVVMTDEKVLRDFAFPIKEDEDTDVMLGESENGLFFGWQNKPAHPPADTSPVTNTESVPHAEAGVIDRVPMFDHVVKSKQNDREEGSVMSVTYKHEHSTAIPTRVEFAKEIIDRYVNGPIGSSTVSYWAHRKGDDVLSMKHEPYIDCDVVLVEKPIYTWAVKAKHDLTGEETVYTD